MLEAQGLTYRYEGAPRWVLRDVSLTLAPGEVVGLSGVSGRGKTTLAKLLAGYLPVIHGRVTLDGSPPPQRGFHPVQLVFQHPELALNPRWTLARALAESGPIDADVLRAFGVSDGWLSRYPHELSGGELQRIALARALRPATRYLICDEISAMLDAITQAQIWEALLAYARAHALGMLVISHNDALLERVCARRLRL